MFNSNNFFAAVCPRGHASETGFGYNTLGPPKGRPAGCQPCPSGFFQEAEGQDFCFQCPHEVLSRGNRIGTISVYECDGITRLNWESEVRREIRENI